MISIREKLRGCYLFSVCDKPESPWLYHSEYLLEWAQTLRQCYDARVFVRRFVLPAARFPG